jgi:uncharacterized protein YwqG
MIPKYTLTFHEAQEPLTGLVTKFGGQPTWLGEPQWPLSRSTERPMRFICQIALDPSIFGDIPGRLAYVFITDNEDEDEDVGGTWESDGGENAIIVQPGICEVPTLPLATGPTLYKMVESYQRTRVSVACEFVVELTPGEDPDSLAEDEAVHASEESWQTFTAYWDEDKIGGTPAFLQGPEFPTGGTWRLLMQLNANKDLFEVNFGDAGIGYAFLSEDGTRGKFLWQCL